MYSILVIETGEFLYEVENNVSLYTEYELTIYGHRHSNHHIYKVHNEKQAIERLEESDNAACYRYRLSETICIFHKVDTESLAIVEV
jgi:hypothetical protein